MFHIVSYDLPYYRPLSAAQYSEGGAAGCQNCTDLGSYSMEPGSTYCLTAAAGNYTDPNDRTRQVMCPVGRYSDGGVDECPVCPAGTFQEVAGQSSCGVATPGYRVDPSDTTQQIPCLPGEWSLGDTAVCDQCDPGSYQPLEGKSSCDPVSPGHMVTFVDGVPINQTACASVVYES